jgi:hypothetical protein
MPNQTPAAITIAAAAAAGHNHLRREGATAGIGPEADTLG